MGDMAMAIAHEVSQPIAAAHNFVAGVRSRMNGDGGNLGWGLENATKQLDRAALILSSLRQYVVHLEESKQLVDLNDIVTDCAYFVDVRANQNSVALHWDRTAEALPVNCEKVLIGQVVLNLAFNAVEEMAQWPHERRTVVVATRRHDAYAVVEVRDTGRGLPHPPSARYSTEPSARRAMATASVSPSVTASSRATAATSRPPRTRPTEPCSGSGSPCCISEIPYGSHPIPDCPPAAGFLG
ncbi:HAMP domain-containing sensor histidine kinase [Streptomyces sp. FXJ1.4098]|nr:HAMP domain-containing sensor histidine kinase [Streptomyces sp. FXJ1.4098]